jgi:hypothetical protein
MNANTNKYKTVHTVGRAGAHCRKRVAPFIGMSILDSPAETKYGQKQISNRMARHVLPRWALC